MQVNDDPKMNDLLQQYPSLSLIFSQEAENISRIQLLYELRRIPNLPRNIAIAAWRMVKPTRIHEVGRQIQNYLGPFTLMQRKAIIFGAMTGLSLDQVVLLKWRNALVMSLSHTARNILRSLPRHQGMEYAFWAYTDYGEPQPILNTLADFRRNSFMSWQQMLNSYEDVSSTFNDDDIRELEKVLLYF